MENQFSTSINKNGAEVRWNSHPSHLKMCLNSLLESGKFSDCFIFVERRSIPCHRSILSMFSPYFEVMLSESFDKHPIIMLNDDVTYQDAEDLLKLIYTGGITVDPARISHFEEVCTKLKIVGFSFEADPTEVDPSNPADSMQTLQSAEIEVMIGNQDFDVPLEKFRYNSNFLADASKSSVETTSCQKSEKSSQKPLKIRLPKSNRGKTMKAPRSCTSSIFGWESDEKLKQASFPCPFCDRNYTLMKYLRRHRRECKSNPDAVVQKCPNCYKEVTPSNFSRHKKACNQIAAGSSNKENEI